MERRPRAGACGSAAVASSVWSVVIDPSMAFRVPEAARPLDEHHDIIWRNHVASTTLLPPHGVEAPWTRAGGREVEPDEAVEHGGLAAVQDWPKTLGEVELEVRHRHFAREQ